MTLEKLGRKLVHRLMRALNRLQTRHVDVRFAATEDEMRQVWQLNLETYARELGQEDLDAATLESGMLVDAHADHSKYIIALRSGELIGMLVLTLPSGSFSVEDSLEDSSMLQGIRDETIEYRRLAVRKEHRGRGVFLRMADFSLAWAVPQGYRYAIMSAIDRQLRTYRRLGFRPIGSPFTKGRCVYTPMMASFEFFASPAMERASFPITNATLREPRPAEPSNAGSSEAAATSHRPRR